MFFRKLIKYDQKPPAGWEAISELVVRVVAAEAGKRKKLSQLKLAREEN